MPYHDQKYATKQANLRLAVYESPVSWWSRISSACCVKPAMKKSQVNHYCLISKSHTRKSRMTDYANAYDEEESRASIAERSSAFYSCFFVVTSRPDVSGIVEQAPPSSYSDDHVTTSLKTPSSSDTSQARRPEPMILENQQNCQLTVHAGRFVTSSLPSLATFHCCSSIASPKISTGQKNKCLPPS